MASAGAFVPGLPVPEDAGLRRHELALRSQHGAS